MNRMTSALRWSAAVLATCAAFPAAASAQVLVAKWTNPTQVYHIYSGMPIACDAPTQRAATTWTNAGSRFSYNWGGIVSDNPRVTDDNKIVITYGPMSNPNYGAITDWTLVWNSSQGTYNFTDADIIVNENYLFYSSTYNCGATALASNQLDYESYILHELGHALGLGDINDAAYASAVMYYQGAAWGGTKRALAAADRSGATRTYGTR